MTRREILRLAVLLGLVPGSTQIVGCSDRGSGDGLPEYEFDGEPGPEDLFRHGVASGDPLPEALILWTRVSPGAAGPVEVFWEMALDAEFRDRVGAGWVTTDAERDFTVKLDATGLEAATTYYYRFRSLGRTSLTGTTRSAGSGRLERLRFAVASCSWFNVGYFHAYRGIAEQADIDAVLHLGDYIYEFGPGGAAGREHDPPREIVSLDDYRTRYAQHRSDPDLQAAHAAHPFVVVWDDHETANNSWRGGAQNHDDAREGPWSERLLAAARAYSEWMPIRDQADGRLFRSFRFGDLVDLVMLDTRIWGRDEQATNGTQVDVVRDPARTLLGFDQEEWLAGEVASSRARWLVVGQQVVMTQWKLNGLPESQGGGTIANADAWDGYHATRARLFAAIREAGPRNLVVLTGDVHSSWASDLAEDPNDPAHYDPLSGRGSMGVELVTPGISSPGLLNGAETLLVAQNPAIKYADGENKGYLVVELDHDRVRGQWFHYADITRRDAVEVVGPAFVARAGTNHLEREASAT